MINIAIVEDEEFELKRLTDMIERYAMDIHDVCSYKCYSNGLEFIEKYKPVFDVIFMDIDMPIMSGMQSAKKLRTFDKYVPLVFITNLKQYALKGYEYEAMDFLVKPITYPEFSTMMSRVRRHQALKPHKDIYISNSKGSFRIVVDSIYYVEVVQHYVIYHTEDGNYQFWGSLTEEEQKLPAENFCKCNKSYIVNLSYVRKVEGNDLYIANDIIPISRGQKSKFMKCLMDYMERY